MGAFERKDSVSLFLQKEITLFQLTFHDVAAGAPDYTPEGEGEMEEEEEDDDEDEMADFIVYEVGEPGLSRCGKS